MAKCECFTVKLLHLSDVQLTRFQDTAQAMVRRGGRSRTHHRRNGRSHGYYGGSRLRHPRLQASRQPRLGQREECELEL